MPKKRRPPERLTLMELTGTLSATLVGTGYHRTLDASTEIWKIHDPKLPYEPILQVDLYSPYNATSPLD